MTIYRYASSDSICVPFFYYYSHLTPFVTPHDFNFLKVTLTDIILFRPFEINSYATFLHADGLHACLKQRRTIILLYSDLFSSWSGGSQVTKTIEPLPFSHRYSARCCNAVGRVSKTILYCYIWLYARRKCQRPRVSISVTATTRQYT